MKIIGLAMIYNKKNKRGWIRIVEAFVALLLIMGTVLIVINKGYIGKSDISSRVYDAQLSILREIELNDELRKEIVVITLSSLPIGWSDFPNGVKNKIITRTPDYLKCEAKICELNKICSYSPGVCAEKDIYAQAVAISATLEEYNPKQLKLFCCTK